MIIHNHVCSAFVVTFAVLHMAPYKLSYYYYYYYYYCYYY